MTIPYEQEFELYHYCESLCSQKARIGMHEKGVSYKSHHIVLCDVATDCDNLTPEYLAVNPKGIVPTLVHNGEPIYDAHQMIRYVDEQRPGSGERLWPDEEGMGLEEARYWFDYGMLKDDQRLGSNFGTAIPIFTLPVLAHTLGQQPLEIVERKMSKHPTQTRGQFFIGLRKGEAELPAQLIETATEHLCAGLVRIDRTLAGTGGPWALGAFSLVDVTMMACFHRLEDVRLDDLLRSKSVPQLGAYWERLQERPSYREAVLDWHDSKTWRSAIDSIFGDRKSEHLDGANAALARIAA